jgi:hypothetical protein
MSKQVNLPGLEQQRQYSLQLGTAKKTADTAVHNLKVTACTCNCSNGLVAMMHLILHAAWHSSYHARPATACWSAILRPASLDASFLQLLTSRLGCRCLGAPLPLAR